MSATVSRPRESMTSWSRHDPVMAPRGNTEHWSIMRSQPMHCGSGLTRDPTFVRKERSTMMVVRPAPAAHLGDGRVDPVANGICARVPLRDLHGDIPGNYASPHYSAPGSATSAYSARSRSNRNNCYHTRATENYEYWYKERPRPTSFGRYGIGSYKTLLGLGNAPRT